MKQNEALGDLRFIGWLLLIFGVVGLIGTIIYWMREDAVGSVLKLLFSLTILYFGYTILYSVKTLSRKK